MKLYPVYYITLHCSDSDIEAHDSVEIIRQWHLLRGFKDVGYNYFITKKGTIQNGRKEGSILAHAKGHNKNHIAICLSGRNDFSPIQFVRLRELIEAILLRHEIETIYYHNELDQKKTCPNFEIDYKDTIISKS